MEFTIYNLNILAPEEKVKSFIEHIYTNYPAVLTGFYKGCLGEKEALRRISVPLACNTGRDYENIICKDADLSGYVYLLNLVTINVEGKK
ncbi:hypothetical protein [Aquifex aeolicus]|uniref:hypothetical protein n=1 Tax=Aquifex aeolicus TaxID=63363 RepID=UPI0002DD684E|nr:hypothetical protein [Aquifex aeolicus]